MAGVVARQRSHCQSDHSWKYCCLAGIAWYMQQGHGPTRNDAAIANARRYCEQTGTPLPFRPRQDISTVEGCMEVFMSHATMLVFRGPSAIAAGKCPMHVHVAKDANGPSHDFGRPGEPATFADLQATARYVLGIEE